MIVSPARAIELLNQGDVVAIPTETVYGLAGSVANTTALQKIFSVKGRPSFDPLIVHVSDSEQLKNITSEWPESAQKLAAQFWPGPLTFVVKKNALLSDLITSGLPHVAVRMPDHPLALEIINATGPLAAPSANKFGKTSPTKAEHVEKEFKSSVAVVDGGSCDVGIESTVIKIEETEKNINILILRPGQISESDIQKCFENSEKWLTIQLGTSKDSPGQLENHYQPEKPLIIADHNVTWSTELHEKICEHIHKSPESKQVHWTFEHTTPQIIARTLYSDMRAHSEEVTGSGYIFLTLPKDYYKSPWAAIRDRIDKASFLKIKLIDNMPNIFVKNSAI